MAKIALFACLVLAVISLGGSQATEKEENRAVRQASDGLFYDPYDLESLVDLPLSYGYQAAPRIADFSSEGRSFYRNPLRYPFFYKGGYEESQPQARLNGLGTAAISNLLFNNRFSNNRPRPLASLSNFIPLQWNPNFPNVATTFDSCTAPTGEAGICAPGSLCSVFGGRPSGSCGLGGVCCINAVTTCGSTVTLNNTFWQSPTTISTPTTCALTVRLDSTLLEQKKPICQVRLDFIAFTTAQTTATGCTTDSFSVGGATTTPPVICGDNAGQHMYLNVPSSATTPTSLQLLFNLGTGSTVTRSWNIKISLLPCGANYLAPANCLQYFTSATGSASSYNFNQVLAARQLINQDYNICFRSEIVNNQRANTICMSPCPVVGAGTSFHISDDGNNAASLSQTVAAPNFCPADFLVFAGGVQGGLQLDRFCGEAFMTDSGVAQTATPVCSTMAPFQLHYRTDNTEAGVTNNGFCLSFQQSFV